MKNRILKGISDSVTTVLLRELSDFPPTGVVKVEDEYIAYNFAGVNSLQECVRGYAGSTAVAHDPDTLIELADISDKSDRDVTVKSYVTVTGETLDITLDQPSSPDEPQVLVVSHRTGSDGTLLINTVTIEVGNSKTFVWDGYSWTTTPGSSDTGITQLTGDVAAGPGDGSQAATLATVNGNVGSFTNADITVDAKGRITAAASGSAGGATTALDNLAAVAINTSLISDTHDTDDFGSLAISWKDGYFAGELRLVDNGAFAALSYDDGEGVVVLNPGNLDGPGTLTLRNASDSESQMKLGADGANGTVSFLVDGGAGNPLDLYATSLRPGVGHDDEVDIGTTGLRFKDLFLSGMLDLNSGENTLSSNPDGFILGNGAGDATLIGNGSIILHGAVGLQTSISLQEGGGGSGFDVNLDGSSMLSLQPAASLSAGQTALILFDKDNGQSEIVTVGAADSGGSGFKVLRIPN